MTNETADTIIEQYKEWLNKEVEHRNPHQVLKVVSITKKPIQNNLFDVHFELNKVFRAIRQENTQFEEFMDAKSVNYLYFKDNFNLNQ